MEDKGQMGRVVEGYFESIFTSLNPSGFDDILDRLQSATMDASLLKLDRDFQA